MSKEQQEMDTIMQSYNPVTISMPDPRRLQVACAIYAEYLAIYAEGSYKDVEIAAEGAVFAADALLLALNAKVGMAAPEKTITVLTDETVPPGKILVDLDEYYATLTLKTEKASAERYIAYLKDELRESKELAQGLMANVRKQEWAPLEAWLAQQFSNMKSEKK